MMEQAHVVLHSLPVHGHIKPLLCLAKLLSECGLYVTFLISHHTHNHLPNLHFESISDGLPGDHKLLAYFLPNSSPKLRPKPSHISNNFSLISFGNKSMWSPPRVTCIIADQYLTYTLEVAEELKIPILAFVGHSASYLLANLSVPKLIEQGHLPFIYQKKDTFLF